MVYWLLNVVFPVPGAATEFLETDVSMEDHGADSDHDKNERDSREESVLDSKEKSDIVVHEVQAWKKNEYL